MWGYISAHQSECSCLPNQSPNMPSMSELDHKVMAVYEKCDVSFSSHGQLDELLTWKTMGLWEKGTAHITQYTHQICPTVVWGRLQRSQDDDLAYKCPDWEIVGCNGKSSPNHGRFYLLPFTLWCQISQDIVHCLLSELFWWNQEDLCNIISMI